MKREVIVEASTMATNSRTNLFSCFFEYETPKVITVKNVPMGILRLVLHTVCIGFILIYQLWYARGYQTFLEVDTCEGNKVKGFSM